MKRDVLVVPVELVSCVQPQVSHAAVVAARVHSQTRYSVWRRDSP